MDNVATSVIENERRMSENNATIAENQQKIYEAGVRAGLAQDPDYAEGYQDGLDSAVGVEWESILDGRTPVGKAREADHAFEATHSANADHSSEATHSANADHSSEADHATNADHSAEATHASEATHSAEATHSYNADYATNAGHSTTASAATNADYATNAGHATTATTSNHAYSASAIDNIGALTNLGVSVIATGSYVGTKISGKPYPNSLTFPFVPKLVIIMGEHTNDQMILINGVKYGTSYYTTFDYSTFNCFKNFTNYEDIVTQWDGNTLRWYYDGYVIDTNGEPYYRDIVSANRQLNGGYGETKWYETDSETGEGHYSLVTPNETYHYIAIG